ncbi:MAG: hypothetical protein M3046_15525 [Actinomycetota bacterium]|nr:hypothetical protein [Actinomycetota bacterium]
MSAQSSLVPLPSSETIRADVQHMVDFGPRLPGYADVVRRIDAASAVDLHTGDPTLGADPPTYEDQSRPVDCAPVR